MAIRLAIANSKGGVGKSTTAMMIADGLAYFHRARVLAIDLDPQASLSTMMLQADGLAEVRAQGRTLLSALQAIGSGHPVRLPPLIIPGASEISELRDDPNLGRIDLLASWRQHARDMQEIAERILAQSPGQPEDRTIATHLDAALQVIDKSYDFIVIDSPSNKNPLGLVAIEISDVVIAPTIPDDVSLRDTADYIKMIRQEGLPLRPNFTVHVLAANVVGNNPDQLRMLQQMRRGDYMHAMQCHVPHSVQISRATSRIGPNSFRRMRDKYEGGSLRLVQALTKQISGIVSKLRNFQT